MKGIAIANFAHAVIVTDRRTECFAKAVTKISFYEISIKKWCSSCTFALLINTLRMSRAVYSLIYVVLSTDFPWQYNR